MTKAMQYPPVDEQPTVAMGMPVVYAQEVTPKHTVTTNAALSKRGFPAGLAAEMELSLRSSPLRFWIVDNSYSMAERDGLRVINGTKVVTDSRTNELRDAVTNQAEISALLGARTDFHHLNQPPPATQGAAPKFISLSPREAGRNCDIGTAPGGVKVSTVAEAVPLLRRSIEPCGGTPLTSAVTQIHQQLAPKVSQLRERGEVATIVIATDGLPNDPKAFLRALHTLQQAVPVWVIVRLCTSDDSVVDYWSTLDKHLERPLEVLDDHCGEASEIGARNEWLTYGAPLHAARLFGLRHKLFDLLDERPLSPDDTRTFCELLLGCGPLPDPELERHHFLVALKAAVAPLPLVFDPRRRRMRPWIDVERLEIGLRRRALLQSLGLEKALGPCLRCVV